MAGLFHTLNIGADSLLSSRQGVDTAGHNIANAQTEGYSRQRLNLVQRDPSETRNVIIGNGVYVKNITRAHDRFLEKHLNESTQILGRSEAYHDELSTIEDIYSPELNSSMADEMSRFFNRLREMSTFPEELTARTSVREAAVSLASTFRRIDSSLKSVQNDINDKIGGEVKQMNTWVQGIAELNVSIRNLEAGDSRKANDLKDQQDKLVAMLNESVQVNYYRDDGDMLVVRGPDETLLVDRGNFSQFGTKLSSSGRFWDIVVSASESGISRDVSSWNTNGKIRAFYEIRDKVINGLLDQNNELAKSLADNVNAVHRKGFGINAYKNTTGRDFFHVSDIAGTEAQSLNITDQVAQNTDSISAGITPDAPGDNVIVNEIVRLENEKLMVNGNATFNDYYANMVGVFGLEVVRAKQEKEADQLLKDDLVSRKEAISGVSMDEEAMNLLKWQANFTASSRVITTVDEMLDTVLNLKR